MKEIQYTHFSHTQLGKLNRMFLKCGHWLQAVENCGKYIFHAMHKLFRHVSRTFHMKIVTLANLHV